MSLADSSKQERIEEFLRKSLLGDELINTQFHLFSAKSVSSRRLTKPRALCSNNVLLAKSSKYFLDLLSSDISPSDSSLTDLTDVNDTPSTIQIDDYGYRSDSDLDDDDEEPPIPFADPEVPKDESAKASTSPPKIGHANQPNDDEELSGSDSDSDSSDKFVMSPEHPKMVIPFSMNIQAAGSVASSETAVLESRDKTTRKNQTAVRLRSLGSRHILVKDTAFQTWYTLLNYLYTGKFNFLPLTSTVPEGQALATSTSALDESKCSAKSMYRLACKVGIDDLRDEALAHIRNNLTEQNILEELSCSIASRHPKLLEMELDVLYAHIASPPVTTGFPALARRIANKELPHGVDIVVGIHERLLKERQSLPSTPVFSPAPPFSSLSEPYAIPWSSNPPTPPTGVYELAPPVELGLNDANMAMESPASIIFGGGSVEAPPASGGLFGLALKPTRQLEEETQESEERIVSKSSNCKKGGKPNGKKILKKGKSARSRPEPEREDPRELSDD